jgi:alpha-ribazole phosphatase
VTRFWWVRHGPTHAKAFAGWRDIPADLSDTAKLARLNAYLPPNAPVISSDLIRATATADALCQVRPRLPHDPDLREFHFGDWDGLGFAEVAERWPDLSRLYWEEPGHIAPPGGESWHQGSARVAQAVTRMAALPDVIIVAHFGVILTQYQRAAGLTPVAALSQEIDNLSVTCLTFSAGAWGVDSVNHKP